jgi:PHD/YefM family antitoxin component YafN of YafNO toxin-antitoxin module
MIAYKNDELIPSSGFAKRFGSYLAQIKSGSVDKLAILKNNRIEAVMLSKDKYEELRTAYELAENKKEK